MSKSSGKIRRLSVEVLESRRVLSFVFEPHADDFAAAEAGGPKAIGPGPAIRLDIVALHEFGHSLGLDHSNDRNSIMYATYNANYNTSGFTSDSAVATLKSLYSGPNTGPWKDSLDASPGNGHVDLTYSFMADGARMDKGTSTTFATFDRILPTQEWKAIFVGQLTKWSDATNGLLRFAERIDTGLPFNYSGKAQNDPSAGDIRIAAHRFDGAGKVLAHAYFPPPNGSTAAGDAHFDQGENWVRAAGTTSLAGPSGGAAGSSAALVFVSSTDAASAALFAFTASAVAAPGESTTVASVGESSIVTSQLSSKPTVVLVAAPLASSTATDDAADVGSSQSKESMHDEVLAASDTFDPPWLI